MGVKAQTQQKVVVAVVDCGFDTTHPYLKPHLREGYNAITQTPDIQASMNAKKADVNYGQTDNHGTHVASTIIQIAGDGGELIPCRVGGKFKNILTYLTTRDDVKIINISMAIGLSDTVERDLLIQLAQQGKIIVKSAGNAGIAIDQGKDKDLIEIAKNPDVQRRLIFVGKTEVVDHAEVLVYPSNFAGSACHFFICAPGDIDSSVPFDNNPNGHAKNWGTSMSAPVLSGTLARLMAEYPQASSDEIVSIIFQSAIKKYGDRVLDPHVYGQGILDVDLARRKLQHKFASSSSVSIETVKKACPMIFERQTDLQQNLQQSEINPSDFGELSDLEVLRKTAGYYKALHKLKITFYEEKRQTVEAELKLRDIILQKSEIRQIRDLRKAASAYKRLFALNKDVQTAWGEAHLRAEILQHPDYQNKVSDFKKAFWAYRDVFDALSILAEKIQVKEDEVKLRERLLSLPNYKASLTDLQYLVKSYRDLAPLYEDENKKQEILNEEVKVQDAILQHPEMGDNIGTLRKIGLTYRDYYVRLDDNNEKLAILEKLTKVWGKVLNSPMYNKNEPDIREAAWVQEQLEVVKEALADHPQETILEIHFEPQISLISSIPLTTDNCEENEKKSQLSYGQIIFQQIVQTLSSWVCYFWSFFSFVNFNYRPVSPNQ